LGIFHNKEKEVCDECGERFAKYDLISHARHMHHHPIVHCDECGKEFIHERERLHHVREEHKKKVESREHKNLHQHRIKNVSPPQSDVDAHRKSFSDNF
jgi:hydrogenase maturation factor HypF (carbamoyltransferase family)